MTKRFVFGIPLVFAYISKKRNIVAPWYSAFHYLILQCLNLNSAQAQILTNGMLEVSHCEKLWRCFLMEIRRHSLSNQRFTISPDRVMTKLKLCVSLKSMFCKSKLL